MGTLEQTCPKCGAKLRFGWWLKWCSKVATCRFVTKREADDHDGLPANFVSVGPDDEA